VLDRLLPNQEAGLCSPPELRRDAGVPEELKDICNMVGLDSRSGLLSTELVGTIGDLSLNYAKAAVDMAIPRQSGDDDVVKELLDHLRSSLPEETDCSEANEHLQRG